MNVPYDQKMIERNVYKWYYKKGKAPTPFVDAPVNEDLLLRAQPLSWIRRERHFYFR